MDASAFIAQANTGLVLGALERVDLGIDALLECVMEQDRLLKVLLSINKKLLDHIDRLEGR